DRQVHDPDFDGELLARWLDTYFESLCRALVEATDQGHLRERFDDLRLVVVTDHGWTDLLREGNARLPTELDAERRLWRLLSAHQGALEVILPGTDTEDGALLRRRLADDWYVIEGALSV